MADKKRREELQLEEVKPDNIPLVTDEERAYFLNYNPTIQVTPQPSKNYIQ